MITHKGSQYVNNSSELSDLNCGDSLSSSEANECVNILGGRRKTAMLITQSLNFLKKILLTKNYGSIKTQFITKKLSLSLKKLTFIDS